MAGGELRDHERCLLSELPVAAEGNERQTLNSFFVTEEGMARLREMLSSGRYEIEVPEEGALLAVAWLLGQGHAEMARAVLEKIGPFFGNLRFYPIPAEQPRRFGSRVYLQNVAKTVESLKTISPNLRILAQKEAIEVWMPLSDRIVDLFLETVDGEPPTLVAGNGASPQIEGGLDVKDGYELTLAYLKAYKQVYPNLIKHDPRFPTYDFLKQRTKPGFDDTDEGVDLIIQVLTADDPRPVWFANWGSNSGTTSSMRRALAKLEKQLSREEFEAILQKIRVTRNAEKFLPWSQQVPLSVDTRNPNRWYHAFKPITSRATGFDENRDIKKGHGPLGALYPGTKEGDSMAFTYLIPTGMNDPLHPSWGSWAGRYELQDRESDGIKPRDGFYWANAEDTLDGKTNRANTLARWRDHLQNDFKARMDWNTAERFEDTNHPPKSPRKMWEMVRLTATPGETVRLDGRGWTDPDGDALTYEWMFYPEPSNKGGIKITNATSSQARFVMPDLKPGQTLHFILTVTDDGQPPLTRYQRVIVTSGQTDQ